jgi:hypothetical protein
MAFECPGTKNRACIVPSTRYPLRRRPTAIESSPSQLIADQDLRLDLNAAQATGGAIALLAGAGIAR